VLNHEDHEENEGCFYGFYINFCELRVPRGDKYIDANSQKQMQEKGD